jgi:alpha-1,3-mannosyltransferase
MKIYRLAILRDSKEKSLSLHQCLFFLFLACSRRLHSIFMLRCFNDCFAIAFTYLAIYCLMKGQRVIMCLVLYSIGISIKMSALLYLPALLMNLNFHFGMIKTIGCAILLIVFQLMIGIEFILHDKDAYFGKAFEFSRVFMFKWSVNWQFLGEEMATGKQWASQLLLT